MAAPPRFDCPIIIDVIVVDVIVVVVIVVIVVLSILYFDGEKRAHIRNEENNHLEQDPCSI